MRMLRSVLVCGVVGMAFVGPMSEPSAEANGGVGLVNSDTSGPGFYTTAIMDAPPYNTKCGNPMPVGKAKMRTTYLNPDGVHFQYKAFAKLENQTSPTITLDFSKATTVDWVAEYHDPDIGSVHSFQVYAVVNGGAWAGVGNMHVACNNNSPTPAADPPPARSTPPSCQSYTASALTVVQDGNSWEVWNAPPTAKIRNTIYVASKKDHAEAVNEILHHFDNICSMGSGPDSLTVFNGHGDAKTENTWSGAACVGYDPKTVTVTNDAKGWWAKSGSLVFGLYQTEADALAIADVAIKRTLDCRIGGTSEPKLYVLHFLH